LSGAGGGPLTTTPRVGILSAVATQPTIADANASDANESAALPSGEHKRDSLEKLRVFVFMVPFRQSLFVEVPDPSYADEASFSSLAERTSEPFFKLTPVKRHLQGGNWPWRGFVALSRTRGTRRTRRTRRTPHPPWTRSEWASGGWARPEWASEGEWEWGLGLAGGAWGLGQHLGAVALDEGLACGGHFGGSFAVGWGGQGRFGEVGHLALGGPHGALRDG
jgi:hypothetical protein